MLNKNPVASTSTQRKDEFPQIFFSKYSTEVHNISVSENVCNINYIRNQKFLVTHYLDVDNGDLHYFLWYHITFKIKQVCWMFCQSYEHIWVRIQVRYPVFLTKYMDCNLSFLLQFFFLFYCRMLYHLLKVFPQGLLNQPVFCYMLEYTEKINILWYIEF